MKLQRREFITLLGGAAAAWPLAARAQQDGRVRRVGWLILGAESDLASRASRAALQGALAKLGWVEGRNLRIDLRFTDSDRIRAYAAELVGLAPDRATLVLAPLIAEDRAFTKDAEALSIRSCGGLGAS